EREQTPHHSACNVVSAARQRPAPNHNGHRKHRVLTEIKPPAHPGVDEQAQRCDRPPDSPACEYPHTQPCDRNEQRTDEWKEEICLWGAKQAEGGVEDRMTRGVEWPADGRFVHLLNDFRRHGVRYVLLECDRQERIAARRLRKRRRRSSAHLLPLIRWVVL